MKVQVRSREAAALVWAVLNFGLACEHAQDRWTISDAIPSVAASPKPPLQAARLVEVPSLDPVVAIQRLELDLRTFSIGLARFRREARNPDGPWTLDELATWTHVLERMERAAIFPAGTFPVRSLIQVRVILEAERERASRPPLPEPIQTRVDDVFLWVDRRLRARRRSPAQPESTLRLSWPVTPIILTSQFGYRKDPVLGGDQIRFHAGLDLAGQRGDPVQAAASGEVSTARVKGGLGRAVFVEHINGLTTVYGHLSKILVVEGMSVERGDILGLLGSSGRSTGYHLHFEVRRAGVPIDPLELLNLGQASSPAPETATSSAED